MEGALSFLFMAGARFVPRIRTERTRSDAGAPTLVIGAGHAGLAMSRCLAERSIDHVVLERGEVANSWRTERWDSLRLLTPISSVGVRLPSRPTTNRRLVWSSSTPSGCCSRR